MSFKKISTTPGDLFLKNRVIKSNPCRQDNKCVNTFPGFKKECFF